MLSISPHTEPSFTKPTTSKTNRTGADNAIAGTEDKSKLGADRICPQISAARLRRVWGNF